MIEFVRMARRAELQDRMSGQWLRRFLRRFRRNEDGNMTIEFVMWFPMLVALIVFSVDVSMTILSMNRGWDVARDVSRRVAVGEMTPAEGEAYVKSAMPDYLQSNVAIKEEGARDLKFTLTFTPRFGAGSALDMFNPSALTVNYVMRRETNSNTGGA